MRNEVTLYTSLPLTFRRIAQGRDIGPTYQAKCLQSWKDAGFDIVSVNTETEIAALKQGGCGIDFVPGPAGRPRIVDLLRIIIASGRPLAGIVNADVVFLKGPEVAADVIASARGSVVMLERINISPETMAPTRLSCCGFDAFIFDTRYLSSLAMDPTLKIGETWWDYWFPLAFHRNGGQMKRGGSPLLMHLDHPQGWDDDQYLANGRRSHAAFAALVEGPDAPPTLGEPDAKAIGDFACTTYEWLRSTARVIDYTKADAAAA